MNIRRPKFLDDGFTLVELLVVITIISILATVVIVGLNSAKSKSRDATRVSDLHNIQIALDFYYDKYGTYAVAGTGWSGGGNGWLGYENGTSYPMAVTRGLYNAGFLAKPIIDDPNGSPSYMIYLCNNNQTYAISATKENPTPQDIAFIQTTCNGSGSNGTYTSYHKNYALTNVALQSS